MKVIFSVYYFAIVKAPFRIFFEMTRIWAT